MIENVSWGEYTILYFYNWAERCILYDVDDSAVRNGKVFEHAKKVPLL